MLGGKVSAALALTAAVADAWRMYAMFEHTCIILYAAFAAGVGIFSSKCVSCP
jgi:hypothetical protein